MSPVSNLIILFCGTAFYILVALSGSSPNTGHFILERHLALNSPSYIMKTRQYNFDPLKPHFYKVKLGFKGVYIIFLISAQKHKLWVRVRTASPRRF